MKTPFIYLIVTASTTGVLSTPFISHHQYDRAYKQLPLITNNDVQNELERLPQNLPFTRQHPKTEQCSQEVLKHPKVISTKESESMSNNSPPVPRVRKMFRTLPENNILPQNGNSTANCLPLCPQAENFKPCTCDPCSKTINCSAITSWDELRDIFDRNNFPIKNYNKFFIIAPHRLVPRQATLGGNIFANVAFKEFEVEFTNLVEVETDAFAGSEEILEVITFSLNPHLQTFPFEQLYQFKKLKKVAVTGGSLTVVPLLSRIPELTTLWLTNNQIANIYPMAFADIINFEDLDLGYNNLQTIDANTLHFSAPDMSLNLDRNHITFIDENAFSGKQPAYVDVSHNHLKELKESVFQPILELIINNNYESHVNAQDNPLCCNSILWVLNNPAYLLYMLLPDPVCSW